MDANNIKQYTEHWLLILSASPAAFCQPAFKPQANFSLSEM